VVYAAHHAFAKCALFIGVGIASQAKQGWQRALVGLGLILATLALAGAPLTSGAIAKSALKAATGAIDAAWVPVLDGGLQLAAVGTTVLMGRFLVSMWAQRNKAYAPSSAVAWTAWLALVGAVAVVVMLQADDRTRFAISLDAIWPVVVGVLLVGSVIALRRVLGVMRVPTLPEGDLLVGMRYVVRTLRIPWQRLAVLLTQAGAEVRARPRPDLQNTVLGGRTIGQLERSLGSWTFAATMFLVVVMIFLTLQWVN
jgi:hypothetical protein